MVSSALWDVDVKGDGFWDMFAGRGWSSMPEVEAEADAVAVVVVVDMVASIGSN